MNDGGSLIINPDSIDFEEEVTEEEVITADAGTSAPVGLYHCTVIKADFKEMSFMNPPCIGLCLNMKINYAIEIDGKKVADSDRFLHQGKYLKDDIAMPKVGEADWAKRRRISTAKKFGLITSEGGKLGKKEWLSLTGKDILVKYVKGKRKNKETGLYEDSGYNNVDRFGGYESVSEPEKPTVSADDI